MIEGNHHWINEKQKILLLVLIWEVSLDDCGQHSCQTPVSKLGEEIIFCLSTPLLVLTFTSSLSFL